MKLVPYDAELTDLMTIDEFVDGVKIGVLTDDDGSGYYGSADFYDQDCQALPSDIRRGAGWKHGAWPFVHWFNK